MAALLVSTSITSWSASTVSPTAMSKLHDGGLGNRLAELRHQDGNLRHGGMVA